MNKSQKIRFNKARKFAFSGEIQEAIKLFADIAVEGVEAANASLAEIYGFLFDWENCLENAGILTANPKAVYAGNVFDDMIRLIGRAGHETEQWQNIESICENAIQRIASEDYQDFQKKRYFKILKNLKGYAERKGNPPHELIKIFEVKERNGKSDEEHKKAFRNAVDDIDNLRPDLRGKFNESVRHKIALAVLFEQFEEAKSLFLENEDLPIYDFDFLVPIMKHLVKIGEKEKAWQVIRNNIDKWLPIETAQIAPVVLLTDKHLKTIINAARAFEILNTTRVY
jgi:hypothetical protein